jgi:hypothetical protein
MGSPPRPHCPVEQSSRPAAIMLECKTHALADAAPSWSEKSFICEDSRRARWDRSGRWAGGRGLPTTEKWNAPPFMLGPTFLLDELQDLPRPGRSRSCGRFSRASITSIGRVPSVPNKVRS